ncbi:uncharacterized protein isoform X2 [Rhodnius prolixus]
MPKIAEPSSAKSPSKSSEHVRSIGEKNTSRSSLSSPSISKLKTLQHSVPYSAKIAGVLQELKDDIVKETQLNHMAGDYIHHTCNTSPKTGLTEVYVEQNGRFTKAPKEIIEQDMNSTLRYLGTSDPEETYNTPLDMAIYAQKTWSVMSKICFGILAGIAVYDLVLLHFHLKITRNRSTLEKFLDMYSPSSFLITKCYHIILTICLITLFDWFDLAHMNLQHFADTLNFRRIWVVTIIYLAALFAALYNFSSDDLMILYDNVKQDIKDSEDIDYTIYFWMVAKKVCCWCCLIGWIFIALTNNEDLFLIHLMAMKKYDYDEDVNQVYENVNAVP